MGSLNTTGSHLMFCVSFLLLGLTTMGLGVLLYDRNGNMLAVSLFNAGSGVFTAAAAVAFRCMNPNDPQPTPPAGTKVTATSSETKTTVAEPPAPGA